MADQTTGWEMQERERRAEHVLAAYRERRRTRRGDDTWFGAAEGLLEDADHGLDPEGASRRRADVVREACEVGMPEELAALMYDVAQEEGLDPVLAFELVRCGLGIFPPEAGLENAPDEPTTDKYRPTWLEPPIPPDEQLRERTLRVSFRRLRGLLERHADDADAAFRAFGREPDAGPVGY
jgi:hypothetical protein